MHKKSREVVYNSAVKKRKVSEQLMQCEEDKEVEDGQSLTQKARTSHLDSEPSVPFVSEMKHTVLDCFSENLRELIVQSLASKISENNYIANTTSSDHKKDR